MKTTLWRVISTWREYGRQYVSMTMAENLGYQIEGTTQFGMFKIGRSILTVQWFWIMPPVEWLFKDVCPIKQVKTKNSSQEWWATTILTSSFRWTWKGLQATCLNPLEDSPVCTGEDEFIAAGGQVGYGMGNGQGALSSLTARWWRGSPNPNSMLQWGIWRLTWLAVATMRGFLKTGTPKWFLQIQLLANVGDLSLSMPGHGPQPSICESGGAFCWDDGRMKDARCAILGNGAFAVENVAWCGREICDWKWVKKCQKSQQHALSSACIFMGQFAGTPRPWHNVFVCVYVEGLL